MAFSVDDMVKLDDSVIKKYHKKMINDLNKRGWAVYKACCAEDVFYYFLSEEDLKSCVEAGSEKEFMETDCIYTVLPYIENDSDWEQVKKVMEECISLGRYPFWVDMEIYEEDEEEHSEINGVYLVDSVVFCDEDSTWELVVDYFLMSQLGIFEEDKGSIVIDLMYTDKVLKQLTKCIREVTK